MTLSKLAEAIELATSHNSYRDGCPPYVRGDLDRIVIAIESAFVVIPRDELPKVAPAADKDNCYSVGGVHMHRPASLDILRECVLRDVALWEHLRVEYAIKEVRLSKRRDELARELLGATFEAPYSATIPPIQRAIDRIIDMEDGNQ